MKRPTEDDIYCLNHFVESHLWSEERKTLGEKIKILLKDSSEEARNELANIVDKHPVFQEVFSRHRRGEDLGHLQEKHTDVDSLESYEESPYLQ